MNGPNPSLPESIALRVPRPRRRTTAAVALVAIAAMLPTAARACAIYGADFFGVVPTPGDTTLTGSYDPLLAALEPASTEGTPLLTFGLSASTTATIDAWKINLTGATGHSPNATLNNYIDTTLTDVQSVSYDDSYVYLKNTDVPSHDVGRADGNNPAYAANQNKVTRITRNPVVATTHATTPQGQIGVAINGGFIFNPSDARSYNNQNVWQQNANVVEASSFDVGPGHSAPSNNAAPGNSTAGVYHYHQGPTALINQVDPGNTGQHHSPIIGYAFDGFPIYGPYGYSDPTDPSSAIKRITSSYAIRSDLKTTGATRHTLADGSALSSSQYGPNVSSTYPAGYYLQDYAYTAGSGDLNEYNVRWTVTPEYPQGTWAYFVTVDANGNGAYPYIVGPKAWGVLDSYDLGPTGGSGTVPGTAAMLKVGDADLDGSVGFSDLLALAKSYNHTGATRWDQGDFNRDGSVDFTDLLTLAKNYQGTSSASDDAALGSTVAADWALAQALAPEPTMLAGIIGLTACVRRRGRSSSTSATLRKI